MSEPGPTPSSDGETQSRLTLQGPLYNLDDYTFYTRDETARPLALKQKAEEFEATTDRTAAGLPADTRVHRKGESYAGKLRVVPTDGTSSDWVEGRALVCHCYSGKEISITIRAEKAQGKLEQLQEFLSDLTSDAAASEHSTADRNELEKLKNHYAGKCGLLPTDSLCKLFCQTLFRESKPQPLGAPTVAEFLDQLPRLIHEASSPINVTPGGSGLRFWNDTSAYSKHLASKLWKNWEDEALRAAVARFLLPDLYPRAVRSITDYCDTKAPRDESDAHLLPFRSVYGLLAQLIYDTADRFLPLHGLIVVSGATGSGKSNIARGLIFEYLARYNETRDRTTRRPHLVTLEEPIEKLFAEGPREATRLGVDYTPRHIGVDTPSLKEGLLDALRQTPAVVYAGEVRRIRDWVDLTEFAGTGHLVVTTAHSGSLVEAIQRILEAVRADTPAKRGQVAQCLRAVVHLQSVSYRNAYKQDQRQNILLPALWRQTPAGIAALVADGLAAILPGNFQRDPSPVPDERESCIARLWFARRLTQMRHEAHVKENQRNILHRAISLDLEGV